MAYATLSDLIDAFDEVEVLQLSDRDDDGTADADVIALVQDRSQSMIDGYLRGRYSLPLSAPYPAVILGIDCDLQRYFLCDNAVSDRVADAYSAAMTMLKDIAAGKLLLSVAAATSGDVSGGVAFSAPARVFSRDTMAGF
jgi:phage gp36-like protein